MMLIFVENSVLYCGLMFFRHTGTLFTDEDLQQTTKWIENKNEEISAGENNNKASKCSITGSPTFSFLWGRENCQITLPLTVEPKRVSDRL